MLLTSSACDFQCAIEIVNSSHSHQGFILEINSSFRVEREKIILTTFLKIILTMAYIEVVLVLSMDMYLYKYKYIFYLMGDNARSLINTLSYSTTKIF